MLQLLAQQKAEYAWAILEEADSYIWVDTDQYNEGALVLVELSPLKQVQQVYDATQWILDIIEHYLTLGITPAVLQEEVQRAEQWRQSLASRRAQFQKDLNTLSAVEATVKSLSQRLDHSEFA